MSLNIEESKCNLLLEFKEYNDITQKIKLTVTNASLLASDSKLLKLKSRDDFV